MLNLFLRVVSHLVAVAVATKRVRRLLCRRYFGVGNTDLYDRVISKLNERVSYIGLFESRRCILCFVLAIISLAAEVKCKDFRDHKL